MIPDEIREKLQDFNSIFPINRTLFIMTRAGILNILSTYVKMARAVDPMLMTENISCHNLRHSPAMYLLHAGVNLVYIRDILGHENIQTTEIYVRAYSKGKREAISIIHR
jgi:integrase/recombinase XerD